MTNTGKKTHMKISDSVCKDLKDGYGFYHIIKKMSLCVITDREYVLQNVHQHTPTTSSKWIV